MQPSWIEKRNWTIAMGKYSNIGIGWYASHISSRMVIDSLKLWTWHVPPIPGTSSFQTFWKRHWLAASYQKGKWISSCLWFILPSNFRKKYANPPRQKVHHVDSSTLPSHLRRREGERRRGEGERRRGGVRERWRPLGGIENPMGFSMLFPREINKFPIFWTLKKSQVRSESHGCFQK